MAKGNYPSNWDKIANAAKADAMWRCEHCGKEPSEKNPLTVHHIDGNTANNAWWNLAALLRECHLSLHIGRQGMFSNLEVASQAWFRPHLAGMLAWRVLGRTIDRAEALNCHDLYVMAYLSTADESITVALRRLDQDALGNRDLGVQRLATAAAEIVYLVAATGDF